ncbi:tRNA (adenosine(37)-N6)-dimethylallyltransferase MiaA [Flavobacteriaceae bacterium R38]|nr:tRNA (adenosine(37)-N6)-dimethylallyltransferase MiaA [Flavobacteriaceae bacterium R38]
MNNYLISIVGPTAIGKTALAIEIAKFFKTEILSADSRQFYKEMKIGTAVPSDEELQQVKHHFIQHKSIFDAYTVGDFEKDAIAKTTELFKNNNILVLVGGSGLYVNAVINGLDDFPEINPEIRIQLNKNLEEDGIETLQQQLKVLDPDYYNKVDLKNPHRLIRALEICIGTNQPFSSFLNHKKSNRNFIPITIALTAERHLIYERINKRVDIMIKEGLVEEAQQLHKYKDLNAMQTVGYRELFQYFEKEWTLEFAIKEIKKNTRRFAKRQLTWYRKDESIIWIDNQTPINEAIAIIQSKINES